MGRKLAKDEVCMHKKNDWREVVEKFGFVRVDGDKLKELLTEVGSESR